MTDLFTIPESKSPRLLWMERHGITTTRYESDGRLRNPWGADTKTHASFGATEDEALANLARSLGIKLWNEE